MRASIVLTSCLVACAVAPYAWRGALAVGRFIGGLVDAMRDNPRAEAERDSRGE